MEGPENYQISDIRFRKTEDMFNSEAHCQGGCDNVLAEIKFADRGLVAVERARNRGFEPVAQGPRELDNGAVVVVLLGKDIDQKRLACLIAVTLKLEKTGRR